MRHKQISNNSVRFGLLSVSISLLLAFAPASDGQTITYNGLLVGVGQSAAPGIVPGGLYLADVSGNVTFLHDTGLGSVNALALNAATNTLYFRGDGSMLYSYNLVTREQTSIVSLGATVNSAGWYGGSGVPADAGYYYMPNGTGELRVWKPSSPSTTNSVANLRDTTNTLTIPWSNGDLIFGQGVNMWISGQWSGKGYLGRYDLQELLNGGNVPAKALTDLGLQNDLAGDPNNPVVGEYASFYNGISKSGGGNTIYAYSDRGAVGTFYRIDGGGASPGAVQEIISTHPIFASGGDLTNIATFNVTLIPEPSSALMGLLGCVAVVMIRRRW